MSDIIFTFNMYNTTHVLYTYIYIYISVHVLRLFHNTWSEFWLGQSCHSKQMETQNKVSRPDAVTHLEQTPIFEWCVVICGTETILH